MRLAGSTPPEAALFARIHRHLTLWYSGVLATALVLFGVVLYAGVDHALLTPIDDRLAQNAQRLALRWQRSDGVSCLPPLGGVLGRHGAPAGDWACYSPQGRPLQISAVASTLPNPPTDALIAAAVHGGAAYDTVAEGGVFGTMRRYAVLVQTPDGETLGVVEVGASVQAQLDALHALLLVLGAVGVLTLGVAAIGGIILSYHALMPARLALERQQSFIADASHELRTPLTLLRADAEVLLRGRAHLDPDDIALVEDIVAETDHMSALATTLLLLARLDAGKDHLEHEVVELGEVANAMVRRTTALAQRRAITIQVEVETPTLVVGDRLRLEQAVLVLVDNAIKYNHPTGRITLTTGEHHGRACLTVADTGIGIASEHLPRLGERFYRVDKARSREAGGTGLGLSIARAIATAHRGTLTLESQPAGGTTATLSLPLARRVAALARPSEADA